jgi:AbrB family looped-hinge helix DNA binding protein
MLVTIDKRGSINLPSAIRKTLNLQPGSCLDLSVLDGGGLALSPVVVYPTVRLTDEGLAKLQQARESGIAKLPAWLRGEMDNAATDSD